MFISKNELDKFSFEDAVLTGIEKAKDGMVLLAEAIIVRARNSQNTNFTDSYAGPSEIKIFSGSLDEVIKCGFKYYDADGNLLREVPDENVPKTEWGSLIKSFSGNYLASLTYEEGKYVAEIEMSEEDGLMGYSYLCLISGQDITVSWEHYLNRVQR